MADPPDDSILNTTKKLLNLPVDYTPFDMDMILHINAVFAILNQLGVGPSKSFHITDGQVEWSAFIGDLTGIDFVRTYMASKIRLLFDPPPNSFGLESLKEIVRELEWRLNVRAEEALHGG